MWSRNPPEKTGWYFYTDNPKDWDIMYPVPISHSSIYGYYTSGFYLKNCILKNETRNSLIIYNVSQVSILSLKGLWFGPIDISGLKIMPPKELLQD